MKILNQDTPTGELNDVKISENVSNGSGTFGIIEDIKFDTGDGFWKYTFLLVSGEIIEVKKTISTC